MEVQLHREDKSSVDLNQLMVKIMQKTPADEAYLCAQESLRLVHLQKNVIFLQALIALNQEVLKVLATFFRAGFLLGRAIEKNALMIHVNRENDAKDTNQDTTSNTANTHTNPD